MAIWLFPVRFGRDLCGIVLDGGDDMNAPVNQTKETLLDVSQARFCSGFGQYYSENHPTNPQKYQTITLAEIEAMVKSPQSVQKDQAQWAIFSTLKSRIHSEQREQGQFGALWVDIDEKPVGNLSVIKTMRRILPGVGFISYTTKSATNENPKCRVIIFLASLCSGEDYVLVQKKLNDRLEAAGIIPDRKTEAAGQICYLPNRGAMYQYHIEPGKPCEWETVFCDELAAEKEAQRLVNLALLERREQSRQKTIQRMESGTISVIDAYNQAHSVEDCLRAYDYQQRGNRWTSPLSSSGSPGVSTEDNKYISSHESDRETVGAFGDPFRLFCYFEHGGDRAAALKAAGEMFTVDGVSLNKANQRAYMESNLNVADKTQRCGSVADRNFREGPETLACCVVADSPPLPTNNKHDSLDKEIERLSSLSLLEYDKVRKEESESLGVRAATLDQAVKQARKSGGTDTDLPYKEIVPWSEKIHPAELLSDIAAAVRRFIVCDMQISIAVTLWIIMTWFMDAVHVAPLAVITAPEKRCGKTQLLTLIGKLVYRAITASNISPAALFRAIDVWKPTLLIDETDACLKDNEELRGIINSGHTRDSAYVIRTVGEDFTPTKFSTWGPKALSGIGHVADTLMDRSIILELRRKLSHENVDRLRYAETGFFEDLAAKLARFSIDYSEQVRQARPYLPPSLNDRAQDNWEPLLAIAVVAGPEWLDLATKTAIQISGNEIAAQSIGVELLTDIQEIFEDKGIDRISSEDLVKALIEDDEKPWATYNRGLPIKKRQLANRLKGYDIISKSVRISPVSTPKGYMKEQFEEAFSRYIPSPPSLSATTPQTNNSTVSGVADRETTHPHFEGKNACESPEIQACCAVADKKVPISATKPFEVEI